MNVQRRQNPGRLSCTQCWMCLSWWGRTGPHTPPDHRCHRFVRREWSQMWPDRSPYLQLCPHLWAKVCV